MWCGTIIFHALNTELISIFQGDQDTEWKYARGELYMEYIQDGSTLPYPLNLIPSPKSIIKFIAKVKWCCQCCCPKKRPKEEHIEVIANFPVHNARAYKAYPNGVAQKNKSHTIPADKIHKVRIKLFTYFRYRYYMLPWANPCVTEFNGHCTC